MLSQLNPRTLFLIDGLGALVSAFMLGVILIQHQTSVGIPTSVLKILATIPCFFAVYSFTCRFALKGNTAPYLKWIAIANLAYCLLTAGLAIHYYSEITLLGISYFTIEIVIVVLLSRAELKASSRP